jgi:hypothetical protein
MATGAGGSDEVLVDVEEDRAGDVAHVIALATDARLAQDPPHIHDPKTRIAQMGREFGDGDDR